MRRPSLPIAAIALLAAAVPTASAAVAGPVVPDGLRAPRGLTVADGATWVADARLGLCRVGSSGGRARLLRNTCWRVVAAPGKPATLRTARGTFIFVPDTAALSSGLHRFRVGGGRILRERTIADETFSGGRPSAAAVAADGSVYVGLVDDSTIYRISAADTTDPFVEQVGTTRDGRGVVALEVVGSDLYVATRANVQLLAGAALCDETTDCVAQAVDVLAKAPRDLAWDGGDRLFVAEGDHVLVHRIVAGSTTTFTDARDTGGRILRFGVVQGLAVRGGRLQIADQRGSSRHPVGGLWTARVDDAPGQLEDPTPATRGEWVADIPAGAMPFAVGDAWWLARGDRVCGPAGACLVTGAVSGTPVARDGRIYVPTRRGVFRVTVDDAGLPVGGHRITGSTVRRAGGAGAVALDADGRLFVGTRTGGIVVRFDDPGAVAPRGVVAARLRSRSGIVGLGAGPQHVLWIAQRHRVVRVRNAHRCRARCVVDTALPAVGAPRALAMDGATVLVATRTRVLRYRSANGLGELLATTGRKGNGLHAFRAIAGIATGTDGVLRIGDGPLLWELDARAA